MTRGRERERQVLRNEWGGKRRRGVAHWVERQAERHSEGALLLSVLRVLWECYAEFDVRTATTLLQA
jgi:hypothetical protein